MDNLTQFLTWLITSAGASAVASFLLERLAAFQAQPATRKPWIVYGASVVIALAAYAVQTYVPADVLAQLQPVFAILAGLTIPFVASQFAHSNDPVTIKRADAKFLPPAGK